MSKNIHIVRSRRVWSAHTRWAWPSSKRHSRRDVLVFFRRLARICRPDVSEVRLGRNNKFTALGAVTGKGSRQECRPMERERLRSARSRTHVPRAGSPWLSFGHPHPLRTIPATSSTSRPRADDSRSSRASSAVRPSVDQRSPAATSPPARMDAIARHGALPRDPPSADSLGRALIVRQNLGACWSDAARCGRRTSRATSSSSRPSPTSPRCRSWGEPSFARGSCSRAPSSPTSRCCITSTASSARI